MMISSALFAFFEGGNLPYLLFYCATIIFAVGYIYMSIQKRFTDAEVIFKETVRQAGDEGECLIIVKCDSNLPLPYVEVSSGAYSQSRDVYSGDLVSVSAEENAWIRLKVEFRCRGIYDFGSLRLKSYDLFHVFSYDINLDCSIKVKVYPKIHSIVKINAGGKDIYQKSLSLRSNIEDVYTLKDVRKYRMGDSLKRIHWKVSAKYGDLFVKESDNISGEEYTLFLDMNKNNYFLDDNGSIEENMVELCASIVKNLLLKGIDSNILLNSRHPQNFKVSSSLGFESFMSSMIEQKSDGEKDFSSFIYENLQNLQKINGIALITGTIDGKLLRTAAEIKNNGYPAAVFYCDSDPDSCGNAASLSSMGINCLSLMEIMSG